MSTSGSKGLLTGSTRQFLAAWDEVRESWQDRKADEFEKTYLSELSNDVTAAIRAIEELDRLLSKIHADCD